jgi:argininosuccinate synthase
MNKLDSHNQVRRVALAYSGGLDTSVMITWLRENYGCEVVAVVGDVGQKEDFDAVCAKALDTGAVACRVVDLKSAFVEECVLPALRAGAIYEGQYLLGTALARPVIARAQVEVARAFGCDAVAHGCTGKGNDQVRFELTYRALAPELEIIAPWREWEITSREDAIAYAEERGIPVPVTVDKPYSIDKNLWHTSFEGGVLENPAVVPPDDLHDLTVDPRSAPKEPYDVVIRFESGIPVALDGEELDPVALIGALNTLAGSHGVGRIDLVENRLVGMKSRGVYETPAGTVLLAALRDLEAITLDRDTAAFKRTIAARYAELVYQGLWFSPLRSAFDSFMDSVHRLVTGEVTVRLFKGSAMPVARQSSFSLYREDLATFSEDAVYDQADAAGFIRLWGLQTELASRVIRQADAPVADSVANQVADPTGDPSTEPNANPTDQPATPPGASGHSAPGPPAPGPARSRSVPRARV